MLIKKLSVIRSYIESLPADSRLRELKAFLPVSAKQNKSTSNVVLVQAVADPYYLALFSGVIRELSKRVQLCPELFVFRSIEAELGIGVRASLKRSFPYIWISTRSWITMYSGLTSAVGYRSVSWSHPLEDIVAYSRAHTTWKALTSPSSLEQLVIAGIFCGDLIIDTYLRFRPAATIDLKDPFLRRIIWQAHRDVYRAKRYFKRRLPKIFLSSYATYIQHGIAARVALLSGTRVVTFGNFQQIGKVLSETDIFHTKCPENYRKDFALREDQQTLLKAAQMQLEARIAGGVDNSTSYMRASAYAKSDAFCPDVSGAVIVYLHDFFDSPHIYADMVFPDFWTWVCFTVETLESAGIPFFLKSHPNQVALSAVVIQQLLAKYPKISFLPAGVTTTQLIANGMACAVTVYGTIAHEVAYLGVPSIACARHPHVAFDFCRTAKTLADYEHLLRNSNILFLEDKALARQQVLEFYAMHNLDLSPEQVRTKDCMLNLWKIAHSDKSSGQDIAVAAHALADDPGFGEFVGSLFG
jgi:hypothetical protein